MNFDFLKPAETMSDEELENEYKAVHSDHFNQLIEAENISFEIKQDLLEHKSEVEQEINKRESGEWFIPLYSFGILDI